MARFGSRVYDITMKPSTYMATTASQYRVVGVVGATTSAEFTGYLANYAQTLNRTATARHAIGINQSYLSSSSETMQVRVMGKSKVICESTISVGDWVVPYEGTSTTSHYGTVISLNLEDATNQTASVYETSAATWGIVLGRAMEAGVTASVIEVMLNPQLYDCELWGQT